MSFTKPTSLSFTKSSESSYENQRIFKRNLNLGILTLNEVRVHYGLKPIGELGEIIYKAEKCR